MPSGTGKQTRTEAPSGQRIGELEEDPARRDVAGDAVDLAEQQRLDPHGEHLVEAQVRALLGAATRRTGAVVRSSEGESKVIDMAVIVHCRQMKSKNLHVG